MSKSKSYRKYAATTMAVAVAASAVAPVVAGAEESKFKDVSEKSAHYDAIVAVSEAGIMTGTTSETFSPYDSIQRIQVAKVLQRALKLEVPANAKEIAGKYSDVNVDKLAAADIDAIAAVTEAGIFSGSDGKFNPQGNITREQIAKVVVEAYGLEDIDAEDVEVDFARVSGAFQGYVQVLANHGLTTDLPAYDGWADLQRDQFASFIKRTIDFVESQKEEDVEAAVESVSAINATEVEVKFTVPVDKDDATNSKVSIQGVNFTGTPELSDDGKTLTLIAQNPIKVTDATVSVEPIKTKADANVQTEKYVGKITYEDKVAPTIVSVEANTNGTVAEEIEIKVSEPLKASTGLVKINGNYVTATIDGTDKIKVTGLSLKAGETHTVELINIEDKAGNKTVSTKADFTVAVDKNAPTVTVSAGESDQEILVTFNKKMDVTTVIDGLANGSVKTEELGHIGTGTVKEVKDSKGTQFTIPVTDPLYTDKDSRTLHVVLKDTIKDSLGNKLTSATQSVTLTKDTVKPVATGYKVVKEDDKIKAIEVNFSKGLKAANAGTILFGDVVDENGVLDSTTFNGFTSKEVEDGDKKVVFEIATAKEINGKYAISFDKGLVTDLSEKGNESDAFSYTIDFGQADGEFELEDGDIKDKTTKPSLDENVIEITFPVAVKGGAVANSATDLSNYTLAGKPLPSGTKITLDSAQKVATITLPDSDSVEKDDKAAVLTVANIKNTTGTKTLKTYTGTVEIFDNVAPVLKSAKVLDNKTIELTYSEAIQVEGNGEVGDSFEIKQGDTVLALDNEHLKAAVASGFDKKLILTIAQGSDTAGTPGTPASATVSGTDASIASIANGTAATVDATVSYTVKDDGSGTLEVVNDADPNEKHTLDSNGNGTFTVNGVTVTVTGGVSSNKFTITTVAEVPGTPATSATTLNLNKDITIETLSATPKVIVDKSQAKNEHKEEVKVTVVKP